MMKKMNEKKKFTNKDIVKAVEYENHSIYTC